jgi:hypothetical protein
MPKLTLPDGHVVSAALDKSTGARIWPRGDLPKIQEARRRRLERMRNVPTAELRNYPDQRRRRA